MSKLTALLSVFGIAPKTLTDAQAQLASAKAQLEAHASDFEKLNNDLTAAQAQYADLTAANGNYAKQVSELTAKVSDLQAKLTSAEATATAHTALTESLTASGVKFDKPEEFKPALDKAISIKAQELNARIGGAPLEETPAADASAGKKKADPNLTGLARTVAAFKARAAAK